MKQKLCMLMLMFAFLPLGFTQLEHEEEEEAQWMGAVFDNFESEIVTASKTKEPIKEAPVPVTVITKDQINRMGAKTLKDVLVTVPGFYFVQDHNEVNVSARGVYASSQQKFLVCRDGHRLNTRNYQEANPDHHISLAGVERIEILRGPGGSLYGDVALTAVVNLISQSAEAGSEVSVGFGNYGQQQLDIVFGKRLTDDLSIMAYGHYFESDGEEVGVSSDKDYIQAGSQKAGDVYVGAFRDDPSYDVGFNLEYKELLFHAAKSYSHYVEPRSAGGSTGAIYNEDDYNDFFGEGRGLSTETSNVYLSGDLALGENTTLSLKGYYDEATIAVNLVTNPDSLAGVAVRFEDFDYGALAVLNTKYSSGDIILGAQFEKIKYEDHSPIYAQTPTSVSPILGGVPVLLDGDEDHLSLFFQIKHRFSDQWILNTGARYDEMKRAYGNDDPDELSPRAALIFKASDHQSYKISYNQSFVEAPYWYRYNSLPSYQGADSLKPEIMESYQFTASIKQTDNIFHEINLFYNDLTDLVYRDVVTNRYGNAGKVETQGVEYELRYATERLTARFNYTFMDPKDIEGYPTTDDEINNIPTHKANLIFDVAPFSDLSDLWFHLAFRYIGERYSPIGSSDTFNRYDPTNEESATTLVNFGLNWNNFLTEGFNLSVTVENLTDEEWVQGGSTAIPYEQAGRWYFVEGTYKFS